MFQMALIGIDVLETVLFCNMPKPIEIDYSKPMVESFWWISQDPQGIKISNLNKWPRLVFLKGSMVQTLIYGPTKSIKWD